MRKHLLILILFTITPAVFSQDWEVPGDRIERLSSFEFSDLSVNAGEIVYNLNCKSCHGTPGLGNFQPLNPVPGDPATEKIQNNSDGALQYKISEGRGLMPSFKRILSPDDIWNLVSYIRNFNPDYTQTVASVLKLTNLKWSEVKILITLNTENHNIITRLIGLEGEDWTPVTDAEVSLLARRYFGSLTLDNPKMTDKDGRAIFDVPSDLPGDEHGGIDIRVQLTDFDLFGGLAKDTTLAIGVSSDAPPLNQERAMWNINRKAPVWVMIAYPGVVLTVWAMIFFVLFRLRAVYKEGEVKE